MFSTKPQTKTEDDAEEKLRAQKIRLPSFMPFFWLALAAVVGSFASDKLNFPWFWWFLLALIGLLFSVFHKKVRTPIQTIRRLPLSLALFVFALSAMLYQISLPKNEPSKLIYYHNKGEVSLTGMVVAPAETKQNSLQVRVEAQSVLAKNLVGQEPSVKGQVIFYLPLGTDIRYGDMVNIRGELLPPEEGIEFSWRDYLRHQGVNSTFDYPILKIVERDKGNPLRAALFRLRERGAEVLSEIFPSPEDSLLKGILLGDESTISPALSKAYRLTGTSHIIAISGFNMSVLAGLVSLVFTRSFGRKRGALITILLLGSYSLLVGASASVLRAAIMGSYAVLGSAISRKGNTLNNLGVSTLLMVLLNPHLPWDVGFQFSFMATLGLSLFSGPLEARLEAQFEKRFEKSKAVAFSSLISEVFLLTLIAQAMVLPISIWHFQEISWLFLLANPLILPVQPAVMVLGLLAMGLGLLWLPLGQLLAWIAWPWVAYSNRIVVWLAQLAPESFNLPQISLFWVGLYYLIFFLIVFRPKISKVGELVLKTKFVLPALAGVALMVWLVLGSAADGKLHIFIPNQSEKSYVFLEAKEGQNILLAGSAGAESLVDEVSKQLPLFTNRLDTLIIPNCKRDTLSGLFVLASKLKVEQAYWACNPTENQNSQNLYSLLEREGAVQSLLHNGDLLSEGSLKLSFQTGKKALEAIQIEEGDFSATLLMPKIEPEDWQGGQLCERLSSDKQSTSLFLNCEIMAISTNPPTNSEEKVKSLPAWSELVIDNAILSLIEP